MRHIRHQVRALLILRSLSRGALYPVPLEAIHTIAYLTDALAAIWNLTPLEDTVLKTSWVPRSVAMQDAINRLVGSSLILVSNVDYADRGTILTLQADYEVNDDLARPIFEVIDADEDWAREVVAISEIATSVAAMGRQNFPNAVLVDASYSDPLLDSNTVLDLEPDFGEIPSRTQAANRELVTIAKERLGRGLAPAELTNLYVRHLFALTESGR